MWRRDGSGGGTRGGEWSAGQRVSWATDPGRARQGLGFVQSKPATHVAGLCQRRARRGLARGRLQRTGWRSKRRPFGRGDRRGVPFDSGTLIAHLAKKRRWGRGRSSARAPYRTAIPTFAGTQVSAGGRYSASPSADGRDHGQARRPRRSGAMATPYVSNCATARNSIFGAIEQEVGKPEDHVGPATRSDIGRR